MALFAKAREDCVSVKARNSFMSCVGCFIRFC